MVSNEKDDFVKCISTGKDLVNLTRWDFNRTHLWALSTTVFFSEVSSHRSWAEQKLSKLSKWTIRVHDTNRNWGSQSRPAEAARPVARSRASVRSHGSLRRNFAPRRQRRATVRLACFLWRYLLPLRSLSRGEAPYTPAAFTSVVYHYGRVSIVQKSCWYFYFLLHE